MPVMYRMEQGAHSSQAVPLDTPGILMGHDGFVDTLTSQLPPSSPSPQHSEVMFMG